MSLEERIELHDQWLRSMESNQSQFSANLGRIEENLARVERDISSITGILGQLAQHQAILSTRMTELAEQQRRLSDTFERYIRFRGNGQEPN